MNLEALGVRLDLELCSFGDSERNLRLWLDSKGWSSSCPMWTRQAPRGTKHTESDDMCAMVKLYPIKRLMTIPSNPDCDA